ncbi:uncharacterized protein LOC122963313 [Acropora millepora]|uniref:uncharacterized protein LOC122950357 n=1 Tax=Acropora millepora TaxID=45264 RepID=UPI001CF254FA|nr:uncharacterized protein LOC122950357 [Acropora millepora]XP_044166354.1 uncharacterized protein LOC122950357 [Acropora millepora]XP_044182663.1 uncharacterized protein LOC122963313 [Acropora millepora]XP_044182664.1 uncharacterized protein LOC122963313 [Acropora millepora]
MAKTVLGEVQSVYGMEKWKKAVIKDAVHQHWKSLRDDFTTKSSKKYEEHRRNVKQNNPPEKKTFQAPLKPRKSRHSPRKTRRELKKSSLRQMQLSICDQKRVTLVPLKMRVPEAQSQEK